MSGGGKEETVEVICNVCDNFECHVFKKKVCRNCFHSKEEHANANGTKDKVPAHQAINLPFDDTGKSTNSDKITLRNVIKSDKSSTENLKKSTENIQDVSDTKVDSNKKKGKPPETYPKSKPLPGKLVTGALSVKERLELKQKSSSSATLDSNKKPTQSGDSATDSQVKGKVSSLVTSQATVDNKSAPVDTPDTKTGEKADTNKKQSLATTKVFTNSKLAGSSLLPQDKGVLSAIGKQQLTDKKDKGSSLPSKDENVADKSTKTTDNTKSTTESNSKKLTSTKFGELSKVKQLTTKTEEFSSRAKQTTTKFDSDKGKTSSTKSDEISSKVKKFSKSITGSEELDDSRFNSVGRKKAGVKDKLPSEATTAEAKTGTTQPQSPKEQGVSQRAQAGTATTANTVPAHSVNKSLTASLSSRFGGSKHVAGTESKATGIQHGANRTSSAAEKLESLAAEKSKVNDEVESLRTRLLDMEGKCQTLEDENKILKDGMTEKEKDESRVSMAKQDVENAIKGLKSELSSMEGRCKKLEGDNTSLMDKLKEQHVQQQQQREQNIENHDVTTEIADMEEQVDASEQIVEELKDENDDLRTEIQDLKVEMDEMYDSFRDQEAEEFRDLQRELEITAKNCRILQFKLRKAERRNESVEADRIQYEDKLRQLQNQFKDEDARAHIRSIEEELQMAKEVSVRLHDELDIMEDRRSKVEEENLHLTDILEKSDKKQFRLEMEIDKLKDKIVDLQSQIANRTDRDSPASDDVSERRSKYSIYLDSSVD